MQNVHSINKLINKTDNSNMYSDEEIDASSSSSANLFTVGLCVKDDKASKQASSGSNKIFQYLQTDTSIN